MRRGFGFIWMIVILAAATAAAQQQPQINTRIPPPPPPPEAAPAPERAAPVPAAAVPPPVSLPDRVEIPAGTRIEVALDTPISTRISKPGQEVSFRSTQPVKLADLLELPVDTLFIGSVVEVKRPGTFGKPGVLRVKVERVQLSNGTTANVVARLNTPDKDQGRISADSNRATDLYQLGMWTLQGTLIGSQIRGGKGAAIGAGAGAAAALIMMMSRRGPDVYLEPGMPFMVELNSAVELPGADVWAAQQEFAKIRTREADTESLSGEERPQLKRRPKNP